MQSSCLRRSRSFCLGGAPNESGLEVEMKNNRRIAFATALMLFAMSIQIAGQSPQNDPQNPRPRVIATNGQDQKKPVKTDRLEPDDTSRPAADVSNEAQANRQEQMSEEEAAISPHYNNFFHRYRLGARGALC